MDYQFSKIDFNNSIENEMPLPNWCSQAYANNGRKYFIDNRNLTTSWVKKKSFK